MRENRSPQPSENVKFDCCFVLHVSPSSLHSFFCKLYCGGQDDTGRTVRHFAHNKSVQKISFSLWMKREKLLSFITVSWSDATELGIQELVLKAPARALSLQGTDRTWSSPAQSLPEETHLWRQHYRKDSFCPVQIYPSSFDYYTLSSNMAHRQETLINHLWRSKSHKSLGDL